MKVLILVRYRLGWIDVYLRFPSFIYVAKNWFGPRKMTTTKSFMYIQEQFCPLITRTTLKNLSDYLFNIS